MSIKITQEELDKFNDLLKAKNLLKNKINECIEEINKIELVLYINQQELEKKYEVKLDSKDYILDLKTGTIRPPSEKEKK